MQHSLQAECEHVKRPSNCYILYRRHYCKKSKMEGKPKSHRVPGVIAQAWKSEPQQVRENFEDLAQMDARKHQLAHPDYRYRPNYTDRRASCQAKTATISRKAGRGSRGGKKEPPKSPACFRHDFQTQPDFDRISRVHNQLVYLGPPQRLSTTIPPIPSNPVTVQLKFVPELCSFGPASIPPQTHVLQGGLSSDSSSLQNRLINDNVKSAVPLSIFLSDERNERGVTHCDAPFSMDSKSMIPYSPRHTSPLETESNAWVTSPSMFTGLTVSNAEWSTFSRPSYTSDSDLSSLLSPASPWPDFQQIAADLQIQGPDVEKWNGGDLGLSFGRQYDAAQENSNSFADLVTFDSRWS